MEPDETQEARERCVMFAQCIAVQRYAKRQRMKGRECTPRSLQQYAQRSYRKDWVSIHEGAVQAAIQALVQLLRIPKSLLASEQVKNLVYQVVAITLEDELLRGCRPRGRPPKPKGGLLPVGEISQAESIKLRRRPGAMTPREEREWRDMFCGVATALWASEEWFPNDASIEEVVSVLVQQPGWEAELRRFIPRAIRHPAMRESNPTAKSEEALIQRARYALKKFGLPEPLRRRRSGGYFP